MFQFRTIHIFKHEKCPINESKYILKPSYKKQKTILNCCAVSEYMRREVLKYINVHRSTDLLSVIFMYIVGGFGVCKIAVKCDSNSANANIMR